MVFAPLMLTLLPAPELVLSYTHLWQSSVTCTSAEAGAGEVVLSALSPGTDVLRHCGRAGLPCLLLLPTNSLRAAVATI